MSTYAQLPQEGIDREQQPPTRIAHDSERITPEQDVTCTNKLSPQGDHEGEFGILQDSKLRGISHSTDKSPDSLKKINPSKDLDSKFRILSRKHQPRLRGGRWWYWEITAACLSLGFAAAVVGILISIHGKPLASWRFPIRPNSLVSIFITLSKATLLACVETSISQLKWLHFSQPRPLSELEVFDSASRGPLGSLVLLWYMRTRSFAVSVGAFVIVIALAMDPFAQQMISYELRPRSNDNMPSSLRAASSYAVDWYNFTSPDMRQINGAMYNGIFAPNTSSPFTCSSGNCTWTEFVSLGACGFCQNVTTTTIRSCRDDVADPSATIKTHFYSCNYTFPNNLTLNIQTETGQRVVYFAMNTSTDPAFESTVLTNSTSLLHIATLDLNSTNPNFDLLPTQQNWEAAQCTLSFCAKIYSDAKVVNGRLDLGSPTEFELVVHDGYITPGVYDLNRFTVPENESSFTGNRDFYIGSGNAGQLSEVLSEFFRPSMLYSGGAIDSSTVVAAALFAAGNISAALADEATSLTNAIRTLSNSTEVRGQTFTLEQYIIVNWAWISLPVATCLLAVTVLIASILLSEQDKGPLWKDSALALLFHNLECSDGVQLQGDVDTVEDMDVTAKSVRAELKKVDGMKFVVT